MKVLLVDDDCRRRSTLIEDLEAAGIAATDIHVAGTSNDARVMLRSVYFNVLVLDVVLPHRAPTDRVDAQNGLRLLEEISRGRLVRPERIIGITAHLSDIESFKKLFEEHCQLIIEAEAGSDSWRGKIIRSLEYVAGSIGARKHDGTHVHVVAVHGIRTFGEWQLRLRNVLTGQIPNLKFHCYRYGHFSTIAFLLPWVRDIEVRRFTKHLRGVAADKPEQVLYIVAHSFGTYLAVKALEQLAHEKLDLNLNSIVLAGSVLSSNYDCSRIFAAFPNARVINDCGIDDSVLLMSEAFVLGTGMAGRVGLKGMNNARLVNRFFKGGHGLYFKEDVHFRSHWLTAINTTEDIGIVDHRITGMRLSAYLERAASLTGMFKVPMCIAVAFFLTWQLCK
jgi:CheY-like chemotaxis protein